MKPKKHGLKNNHTFKKEKNKTNDAIFRQVLLSSNMLMITNNYLSLIVTTTLNILLCLILLVINVEPNSGL